MLTTFDLQDFKSYGEARLPLGALTVLIGANASGKSNAIEALRLLSWLAQGQKLGAIKFAVNEADKVVRGRVEDLCRQGHDAFKLGCTVTGTKWSELFMRIVCRDGELHIAGERVRSDQEKVPLYDLDQPSKGVGTDAGVAYNNFSTGPNKPHVTVSDQMAVFSQLDSPASFQVAHKKAREEIPKVSRLYQQLLANILFLDPVPARMRDYSFENERRLNGDGANLSSVLYALWGPDEKQAEPPFAQQRQDILAFIQSLPEQAIARLDFLRAPRGEVMVRLVETFGGTPKAYDAPLLSDGTLRVLAIAAAMLSAAEGSLVVIEEIDNGVHPSRARHLLERIEGIAKRRQLRVLLSTHNPALLDALPPSALEDVVFCYRDPQSGASRLVRLADVPDVPELLVQGSLGHLMTSGALERFVKHHPGPDARKAKAKAWLQSLQRKADGEGSEGLRVAEPRPDDGEL
ncbi:MAG: AAA family ATPase [Rubrivivax sp.]|nr:AAA family ATPase [Rubrivivax sp.]